MAGFTFVPGNTNATKRMLVQYTRKLGVQYTPSGDVAADADAFADYIQANRAAYVQMGWKATTLDELAKLMRDNATSCR